MSKINFDTITNSQKWKFLRSNTTICSFCNKEKKLVSFFVKETNSISNMCKICYNKNKRNNMKDEYYKEIDNIITDVINTREIEELLEKL